MDMVLYFEVPAGTFKYWYFRHPGRPGVLYQVFPNIFHSFLSSVSLFAMVGCYQKCGCVNIQGNPRLIIQRPMRLAFINRYRHFYFAGFYQIFAKYFFVCNCLYGYVRLLLLNFREFRKYDFGCQVKILSQQRTTVIICGIICLFT